MPVGAGLAFGTDNQIPCTNAAGDDFEYTANFIFDGTLLRLGNSQAIALGPVSGSGLTATKGDIRFSADFELNAWNVAGSVNQGIISKSGNDIWIGRSNTEGVNRESVRGSLQLYTASGGSIIGTMGSTFDERWRFQSSGGSWAGLSLEAAETGASLNGTIHVQGAGGTTNSLLYKPGGSGLLTTLAGNNGVNGTLTSWSHVIERNTQTTDGVTTVDVRTFDVASATLVDNIATTEFKSATTWMVRATLIGYSTAGTADKAYTIELSASFRSVSSTLTQIGTTQVSVTAVSDAALAAVAPVLNCTGSTIRLQVVGVAAVTIQWRGILELKAFKTN